MPQITDQELRTTLAAIKDAGSVNAAATKLGVSRNTLQSRIRRARQQGRISDENPPRIGLKPGWDIPPRRDARGLPIVRVKAHTERRDAFRGLVGGPPIPPAAMPPEGFIISRNSGVYDKDGALQKQWVGTVRDSGPEFAIPAGHVIKGESALVDPDGRVLAKWIKTREGSGEGLVAALQQAFSTYSGLAPSIPLPAELDADTWTIYPVPDLHLGMLSWSAETGEDYDVKIATAMATGAITELVRQSRPSSRATLIILGDYQHANDQRNVTPGSGHQLDVDGRHSKIYLAGANLVISLVNLVAEKHAEVEIVVLPGNHDPEAATTLAVALSLYYSGNARMSVNMKPGVAWYRRFGRCLVGAHHGHTQKPDRAAMAMAVDRGEDWGQAPHRYIFTGHFHSERVTEVGNVRVETLQSPAARDAWNTASGYRSGRSLSAITFHKDRGEIGRHRVTTGGYPSNPT